MPDLTEPDSQLQTEFTPGESTPAESAPGESTPGPHTSLLLIGGVLVAAAALAVIAILFFSRADQYNGTATGLLISGGSSQLCVEMARTEAEREVGLSGRTNIGDFDGMAFLNFDETLAAASNPPDESATAAAQLTTAGFWMKNTLIPLDLVFVGGDGRVVSVESMEPCSHEPCRVYNAPRAYLYAIELPAGWAREFDIRPGVRLTARDGCIPFDRD